MAQTPEIVDALSRYNFTNLTYPEDLVTKEEYNGNKIVFFINVSTAGKLSGTVPVNDQPAEYKHYDIPPGDLAKFSGQKVASKLDFADVAAANMKRLSAAIALHMPNAIQQSTSVSWSEEDFTTQDETKYLEGIGKVMDGKPTEALTALASGAIAQKYSQSMKLQKASRITPGNSKQEMLFRNVDFRTFDFSFQFHPKSESEAANVMRIIRMFKHHMLPEFRDSAQFLYIYPSEFNIKYYKGSDENQYIEKQLSAVLMGINIDSTPNGQFNSFPNGMPSQIGMSLRFKETGVPTKETSPYNKHGV